MRLPTQAIPSVLDDFVFQPCFSVELFLLTKLNLDQNPIIVPPIEVVNQGAEAVKEFMAKWWLDLIEEAQQKSMSETQNQQAQTGWLAWGASLLNNVAEVSESVAEYFGAKKAPRDPWLDQQL